MVEKFEHFFGTNLTKEQRVSSYDLIEYHIESSVKDWSSAPDTDRIASEFANIISAFTLNDFSFLLCHSGYIPEFYEHDSSQETLYSKLIEIVVCEWAKRVGFKDSYVQKQKASKEDVTIQIEHTVIVCDAKSYRLGRSQSAPNVKDTIKKADYEKWQDWWHVNEPHVEYGKYSAIGGLITFPSMHRWKGSSDAYLYATDKHKPIVIIFYEYLAYFLLKGYRHENLISLLEEYPNLFPTTSKDQHTYFDTIVKFLFKENGDDFFEYLKLYSEIAKEKVVHTIDKIDAYLKSSRSRIELEIKAIQEEKLRDLLVDSKYENVCGQIIKQLENIKKFRPH